MPTFVSGALAEGDFAEVEMMATSALLRFWQSVQERVLLLALMAHTLSPSLSLGGEARRHPAAAEGEAPGADQDPARARSAHT